MKFVKRFTFLVLFVFVANLIMPSINIQAFKNSNISEVISNEELDLISEEEVNEQVTEDVNFKGENIGDGRKDVNKVNEGIMTISDEPVVIKLENPIQNHKLTGSFL